MLRYNTSMDSIDGFPVMGKPACIPLSCYKRMNTVDLEEAVDLSTKTETEIEAILKELRLRYRLNMMSNAQLDNEKQALDYQLDDMKDQVNCETSRKEAAEAELKSWTRHLEEEKRRQRHLDLEICRMRDMISSRDQVIKDNELVMVQIESPPSTLSLSRGDQRTELEIQAQRMLQNHMTGTRPLSLDQSIRQLILENDNVKMQIGKTRQDLNELREDNLTMWRQGSKSLRVAGHSDSDSKQREKQQQALVEQKQEVNRANLRIDSLENQLLRLEAQMHRYREGYEDSEKSQQQLKADSRKLSRQFEELSRSSDDLDRECAHLKIRLDKVRSARYNALRMASADEVEPT